jgi:hypothetical protein
MGVVLAIVWSAKTHLWIANGMQMILTDDGVFGRVATFGVAAGFLVGGVVFWAPTMKGAVGRLSVVLGNASYST